MSLRGGDPVIYFSFDDMTGIIRHGSINITSDDDVSKAHPHSVSFTVDQ